MSLPVIVVLAKTLGLYERDEVLLRDTTLEEAPRLAILGALTTLFIWLGDSPFLHYLSKPDVLVLWGTTFAGAVLLRRSARAIVQRRLAAERCLVIGDERAYRRMRQAFNGHEDEAVIAGRLATERVSGREAIDERALRSIVRYLAVDRVIVATHGDTAETSLEMLRAAKELGVRVSVMPTLLGAVGPSAIFDDAYGVALYSLPRLGLRRDQWVMKRAFDFIGAILALTVLGPLFALIAIVIKLESRGPVFFRQVRIGRDGKPFKILKFRTMVEDAEEQKAELRRHNEADGLFKIANDPRITRVGRFLRRTSLDELPQLFNVVSGHMSLVGPRPLVADEDARIQGSDRRRLLLTPGMTGHWQILGSARIPMAEMVRLDYRYVASWSLWGDIKLCLRTIPYVLARRGM